MPVPNIVVVTGASGAGKTTLVGELERRALAGVRCSYFDSIGVPSPGTMAAQFGSSSAWQEAMTRQWVARLVANVDEAQIVVLDGQVRPLCAASIVITTFERASCAAPGISPAWHRGTWQHGPLTCAGSPMPWACLLWIRPPRPSPPPQTF